MNFLKINTLYIELTHACNQHCKHCYLNGGMHHAVAELTTEQIKKIFCEFKEQGGGSAVITGGEPLMRKDIWDILDYVEELEIPFTFASNSLAMNAERRARLASYKYLALYFTSILGVDAKKHQYITEKDSYDNVMETLQFFTEQSIPTYVQVTLARDYVDDIEKIAKDLMQFSKCVVKFTPIATLGVKEEDATEEQKRLIIMPEEFESFHKKVENLQKIYPGSIEDSNIQNYEQISKAIADYEGEELYSLVYGFVAVRPNGDLSFSCNMGNPYVFGKAYESMKIPVDEKLEEYIDVLRRAEKATLEKAREGIVEFDVTVDKYVVEYH
ncbi:MAG: radical SAM protein [Agathobacter sp.]|nr:radical SAM protein [Agathobacter sp.]